MATLFDTLRGNLQGTPQQQIAGVIAPTIGAQDSTSAIQRLSSAATGKASMPGTGTTPRLSNLAEQVATNEAQLQQQGLQQQGQIAAQGMQQEAAAQTQQEDIQQAELDEQGIGQQEQYNTTAANLIRDFENKGKQLDLKKDASKLEQLGMTMRLGDDKYVTRLQAEGRRSRLDNEANFNDALTKSIFEDEQGLFDSDLQFRSMMRADDREFNKEMSDMSLDFSQRLADSDKEAANQRLLWGSVGGLISAGAQGYSMYKGSDMSKDAVVADANTDSALEAMSNAPTTVTSGEEGGYWTSGSSNKAGAR